MMSEQDQIGATWNCAGTDVVSCSELEHASQFWRSIDLL